MLRAKLAVSFHHPESQWWEFTDEESLSAFSHDLTARCPDTFLLLDEFLKLLRGDFPRQKFLCLHILPDHSHALLR